MVNEDISDIAKEVERVYKTFSMNAEYSSGRITQEQLDSGLAELTNSNGLFSPSS